jgi:hypothetical protein
LAKEKPWHAEIRKNWLAKTKKIQVVPAKKST